MPMVIRSFDVIVIIEWLSRNHVNVLCFEKALCLPLPNGKALIIYGDKTGRKTEEVPQVCDIVDRNDN